MPRPLVATIDIAALQHNLHLAQQCAPGARTWAVVKADAYGHGLERGMRAFAAADGLALVEFDRALRLRELGWRQPILLLEGFFQAADLALVAQHQLQVTVHCNEQIQMLEQAQLTTPIDIHLKMNSGMNRLGFTPDNYRVAYARVAALQTVRHITLMTHFANADCADQPALPLAEQVRRFHAGSDGLPGERCIANSAATLLHAELANDWIRPGIMLYGGTPNDRPAAEFGLRAGMILRSEIIGIQHIQAGDAVGYGSCFVANQPTVVGVVACGYADGYPRHAPSGTPIIVDGVRTTLVGRVSMDMLMVDLTPVAGAHVGSQVLSLIHI